MSVRAVPRRVRRAVVAALAGGALLAGCAAPIPTADPDPAPPAPLPVLDATQTEDVLTAVDEALRSGDEARDVEALRPRVEDPALAMRAAQYTLQDRSNGERPPTPLTTSDQVVVIAASDEWPRTLMAITQPAEGATSPLLLTLRQDDPRSPYRLWSWARLFPGVQTPAVPTVELGSPPVPADASGYVTTPAEALAHYADVLLNGSESQHADEFADPDDPFVRLVRGDVDVARTNLSGIADVQFEATPVEGQVVALGTAEESALVVGVLTLRTTYTKTLEGSTVTLGGDVGWWLGENRDIPQSTVVTHTSVVGLSLPAEAEGAQISVLGAERVLADVTRQ